MNPRYRVWLLVIPCLLLVGFLVAQIFSSTQSSDGKEPELGGPRIVAIENSGKLNAVLQPPEFFAAKGYISSYILESLNPQAKTALIESTQVEGDGGITLKIKPDKGQAFEAKLHHTGDELVFEIPAVNYKTADSLVNIENNYGGGN